MKKARAGHHRRLERHAEAFAPKIAQLIEASGTSQAELANTLGAPPSRVSEWAKGKRVPPPEALIRLGAFAAKLGLSDASFFWSRAGVDRETLALMADSLLPRTAVLPEATVSIPRYRDTVAGRVEAGRAVPLPIEFVPHPGKTICLMVDERSSAVVDAPRGLFVLDASIEGQEDLSDLWGAVVILRHPGAGGGAARWPSGLYAGRLTLRWDSEGFPEHIRIEGSLAMLGRERGYYQLPLGAFAAPNPSGARARPEEADHRIRDAEQRARSEIRLSVGIRILGRVIGRLTGHIEPSKP